MTDLMSMDIEELKSLLAELDQPSFRAKQVFSWLSRGTPPEHMTNLPKALREELAKLPFGGAVIHDKRISKKDGTIKYLFELSDGNIVEGVLMSYNYGNTLCISTQVGCRMNCAFCASAIGGFVRHLTAGEMLSFIARAEEDVLHAKDSVRTVTNIVLMGSGEPLDNYDHVVRFLKLVTHDEGMRISARNISLSTSGLVPEMNRLIDEAPPVTLCVSLHAPRNEVRDRIMPINRKNPIERVLDAAKRYEAQTGRRVIFEYALILGVNDGMEDAKLLARRLKNIHCHVNLIPLNDVAKSDLHGVSRHDAERFMTWLTDRGISATIRRELGTDIEGACGQLRRHVLENRG